MNFSFFFFFLLLQYSQNEYVLKAQQTPNQFPTNDDADSLFKVWWLHIPKTGTSIINTIARFCCSRIPESMKVPHDSDAKGWLARQRKMMSRYHLKPLEDKCKIVAQVHEPFSYSSDPDFWITFVRDPRIRLRSAYQYKMLTPGLNASMKEKLQATVSNLVDFSVFPGVKGCQTKMFTGYQCSDHTANISISSPTLNFKIYQNLTISINSRVQRRPESLRASHRLRQEGGRPQCRVGTRRFVNNFHVR